MYQYILFDLDGTITESGPGIMNSVAYAVKKMGYAVPDNSVLRRFIGPPLSESFQKYFGMSGEQAEEAIRCYREYYTNGGIFENEVYEGIVESFQVLKENGRKLAIATSKPEKFAKQIAEYFGFDKYFDVICGASMDESLVAKADIFGAKKNQVASLGVLYGYGDRTELEAAGADYIVEKANQIAGVVLE